MPYNPEAGIAYAHKWAFGRNPRYYDFDPIGGDCTNFISQCLYAASSIMNYTPVTGWYYNSLNSRSPAWSGVEFLYKFLTSNKSSGPYGHETELNNTHPGDIIQLSFDGINFGHSLYVVSLSSPPSPANILIATHTFDADYRSLGSYIYTKHRLIHIDGVRA